MSEKARQSMVVTKGHNLHPFFVEGWVAFEQSASGGTRRCSCRSRGLLGWGGAAERTNGGEKLRVRTGAAVSPIPSTKGNMDGSGHRVFAHIANGSS